MVTNHSTVSPTETKPRKPMNVYIVWMPGEYYLIVSARSHSHAKYVYCDIGGNGWEAYQKSPDGTPMHAELLEKDAPYDHATILWDYEEKYGVDLMLSGVLIPGWMWDERPDDDGYDYRRWDGFRKPRPNEFEHADPVPAAGEESEG